MTYKLTVTASANGYKPIIKLEETNGSAVVKGATGVNLFFYGAYDLKFRPENLSMDFTTMSGRSISLVYANINAYNIFGTTSGLANLHAIWDQIVGTAPTSF